VRHKGGFGEGVSSLREVSAATWRESRDGGLQGIEIDVADRLEWEERRDLKSVGVR